MKYNVSQDLKFISEFMSLSLGQLSEQIDIPKETLSRINNGAFNPSNEMLERIYGFIYDKNIKLNEIKVEAYKRNHNVVLFHGAKDELKGELSLDYSRSDVDFGVGFYTGDNYNQSLDFICQTKTGSVYILDVDYSDLKVLNLDVSLEWIILIAINRGKLDKYKSTKLYQELTEKLNSYDVIIAPIADNRMFTTIDDFTNYAITTEQAIHAIKDLSLGKQIVFKTKKALAHIKILERLFITKDEKRVAIKGKIQKIMDADSFVTQAYQKYIRKGLYINEVFDDEGNGL